MQVIRRFTIMPNEEACANCPQRISEWREYDVVADYLWENRNK